MWDPMGYVSAVGGELGASCPPWAASSVPHMHLNRLDICGCGGNA
jgi:hypothetical protein